MNPLSFIKEIFTPAAKLIDDIHTSDEERLEAKRSLLEVQTAVSLQLLDYEKNLMEQKHSVIIAEAQGGSWLQRSWRPITMLTFLGLVVMDSLGLAATPLAPEAWTLLQLGLGGYVVGRSAEKVIPNIMDSIGRR